MKDLRTIGIGLIAFIAILFAVIWVIYWDASNATDLGKYGENSWTEKSQVLILITATVCLGFLSRRHMFPTLCLLMAGCTAIALVREFDAVLDTIFDGAWQTLAGLILSGIIILAYKKKTQWSTSLKIWSQTRSFGITFTGFLVIFLFSRLFGKKTLWMEIMGNGYERWVKNAAEEGIELLGYGILLAGILDFLISHYQKKS